MEGAFGDEMFFNANSARTEGTFLDWAGLRSFVNEVFSFGVVADSLLSV